MENMNEMKNDVKRTMKKAEHMVKEVADDVKTWI